MFEEVNEQNNNNLKNYRTLVILGFSSDGPEQTARQFSGSNF